MESYLAVVSVTNLVTMLLWWLVMLAKERDAQRARALYLRSLNRLCKQIADDGARLRFLLELHEARRLRVRAREAKTRLDAQRAGMGDAEVRIDVNALLDLTNIPRDVAPMDLDTEIHYLTQKEGIRDPWWDDLEK